jgi:CubicO group peptidase (beta-lactamase class C family)
VRRLVRVLLVVTTTLVVLAGGTLVWAHLSIDRSGVARALVWRDADVYDIDRFDSRPIAAGSAAWQLPDCDGHLDLDEVTVTADGTRHRLADLLRETRSRGFLVVSGGCVLAEHYALGAGPSTLLTSFSVAKSVLSTLVGIAVDRADLPSIDEPITRWLPELSERDERFGDVTLRDLMSMSSGLRYVEHGLPWSDDAVTYYSPDLRAVALSAEVEEPPGRTWLYNNFNPLLVGMVLERATGTTVSAYAEKHLWGPLGAEDDASWSIDSIDSGLEKLESGYNATLRDWGRCALMVASGGQAGGRRVVSRAWLEEATSPQATEAGAHPPYGLWWWLAEDDATFTARGNKGQFLHIDPATGTVVARFGEDTGIEDWPDVLAQVARAAAGTT